jgi:hypothetical protein
MKNKNWNVENIVKKWRPVIESLNFKESDIQKVCEYAELHALEESTDYMSLPKVDTVDTTFKLSADETLLPLSLRVLSKINDLSKVHFVDGPAFVIERNGKVESETVKTYSIQSTVTQDQIMQLKHLHGIDVIDMVENELILLLVDKLNSEIEMGNDLYVYLVAQSIRIITVGTEPPRIMMSTRFHAEEPVVTMNDL